jgi:flagellar export protein FliJ
MLKGRLNRIIEIKEKMMEDKEREIEEAKASLEALFNEIRAVDTSIEENYEKISIKTIQGNDFSVVRDYIEYLENTKYALMREAVSLDEKVFILKQELVELLQEKKMLDKLHIKEMASLKKSFNRREQKLLDDMALRIDEKSL